jgi:hypothetical protein
MIINFRTCRISRDIHKLTRTLTLKKKLKRMKMVTMDKEHEEGADNYRTTGI